VGSTDGVPFFTGGPGSNPFAPAARPPGGPPTALPSAAAKVSTRVLVSVSPRLNGSEPAGASLCVGVIRLRGVTPPPRSIDRCRCIGRRIVRNRSGIIRSSQCTGDDPTDDRWCPPTTTTFPTIAAVTTASPTATAMMTLRLRCTSGTNHDSRAQSDDSFFHLYNIRDCPSQYNVNI
jgi:hypothetical protein